MCTLSADELVYDTSYLFISCKDSLGNMNGSSTSGHLKVSVTGLESTGRAAIGAGVQNALLANYTNYTTFVNYALLLIMHIFLRPSRNVRLYTIILGTNG